MNPHRSPREILLDRHAAARPALDAQREILLTRFAAPAGPAARAKRPAFSPIEGCALLWRELVVPCRRTWVALAAAWVAILAIQQLDRLTASAFATLPAAHTDPTLLALWLEQRRLLAEFGATSGGGPVSPRVPAHLPSPEKSIPAPDAARPLGGLAPASTHLRFA